MPRLPAPARQRGAEAIRADRSGTSDWEKRTDGLPRRRHRRHVHRHRPPGRRRERAPRPSPPPPRRSSSVASWPRSRRWRGCAASARGTCSAAASSCFTAPRSRPTRWCSCAAQGGRDHHPRPSRHAARDARPAGAAKGLPVDQLLHASRQNRPQPIVSPELIAEVDERVDSAGEVVVALDEEGVANAARELVEAGADAIADLLPVVGRPPRSRADAAQEIVREAAPDRYVTCSHLASARSGEYERFAAAAINAFLGPETDGYLTRLKRDLGGNRSRRTAPHHAGRRRRRPGRAGGRRCPMLTIGSGPSAGVGRQLGARRAPRRAECDRHRHGRHELRRRA